MSVYALEPTTVLLVPARRLLEPCQRACPFHARLIRNLVTLLAEKNLQLSRYIRYLSARTIREKLTAYLGAVKYMRESLENENRIGVVNGLAYTSVGGEMLSVECAVMQGTGVLQLTGKLGDVMQESAKAALSWVRAHSEPWGIPAEFYKNHDIHIHVPEGAVPKDGPSAGVTLIPALVSALTSIPVRQSVAMTGEITLRGRVLPIGGLKEKLMAAYRAGVNTVLIPRENLKDLEDISQTVRSRVEIRPVESAEEVIRAALVCEPPVIAETQLDAPLGLPSATKPSAYRGL